MCVLFLGPCRHEYGDQAVLMFTPGVVVFRGGGGCCYFVVCGVRQVVTVGVRRGLVRLIGLFFIAVDRLVGLLNGNLVGWLVAWLFLLW